MLFDSIVTASNLLQFSKAPFPIYVILSGTLNVFILLHSPKQLSSNTVILPDKFIPSKLKELLIFKLLKLSHPKKHSLGILVRLFGNVTVFSFLQKLNAQFSSVVFLSINFISYYLYNVILNLYTL